jgi:ATP-binding cassette subfamily C protein
VTLTTEVVNDTVDAFQELVVFKQGNLMSSKFEKSRKPLGESLANIRTLFLVPRYIIELSLVVGVVILVFAQSEAGSGMSSTGTLGIFLAGAIKVMSAIVPLQNAMANIQSDIERGFGSAELSNARRQLGPDLPETHAAKIPNNETEPIGIQIENLSLQGSDTDRLILEKINLEVKPGDFVAIVGPSGSGKTTLGQLIAGLHVPTEGTIEYLSSNGVSNMRLGSPDSIAYVAQKPGMISGSILDNILFGRDLNDERLKVSIEMANIESLVQSLPDGVHTSLGSQNNLLSGGQLQRIGLARALYGKPNLLVLDESTSALDSSSEAVIRDSLLKLKSHVTLVVIAHRWETIRDANVAVLLSDGKLAIVSNLGDNKIRGQFKINAGGNRH